MSTVDRAAAVIGQTWYRGGGSNPGYGPSWEVLAEALRDAGLLVTDEDDADAVDRRAAIDEMVADAIADFGQ